MKLNVLRVLAVGVVVGGIALAMNTEKAEAAEWSPRSVEAIKADVAKAKDNQYTIVWGDTLSGISQATNLTVQKLADLNKITNVDLIYAGNTLVFEGNVATVQNKQGETIAQTVIQPEDKNDASKPVGKQEPAKSTTDKTKTATPGQNEQGTAVTSEKTDKSSQETNTTVSGTNGSQSGTITSSGTVETPAQQSEPATPSQPTQPSKPAEKPSTSTQPSTPTQPSTGGEQGGSTTVPVTDPSTVTDQEPLPEMIGNSGKVFNSRDEANNYGYAEIEREDSEYSGFWVEQLVNKNAEPLNKFTVDFYKDGPLD